MLTEAPTIVCRNCGETWPIGERPGQPDFSAGQTRSAPVPEVVEARRAPLVTYSGEVDKAWAAKMDGDWLPPAARQRSRIPLAAAALSSALFIAAFLGGRDAAVAALPDLAGLYDALGMPVNLDGLEIRAVKAERAAPDEPGRVSVRGEIINASPSELRVPPLHVTLYDARDAQAGHRGFDPPGRTLKGGESAPFTLQLDDVPEGASEIVLRFRRIGQAGPQAFGQGEAAQ